MTPRPDHSDIVATLKYLLRPGQLGEIRTPGHTAFAYGSDADLERVAAVAVKAAGKSVWLMLNPIRTDRGTDAATDADIERREFILIDVDAKKPAARTNASQVERDAAEAVVNRIYERLADEGILGIVAADSGNGYHILVSVNLPNDDASREIVKSLLNLLASEYDADGAEVDQSTFNASRLAKLYGTVARKGPHSDERPHRLTRLIHTPDNPRQYAEANTAIVRRMVASVIKKSPPPPTQGLSINGTGKHLPPGQWSEHKYVNVAIEGELSTVRRTPSHLNDRLFKSAAAVGRFVGAGGVDRDAIEQAIFDAAVAAGADNPTKDRSTIRRGLDTGAATPWTPDVRRNGQLSASSTNGTHSPPVSPEATKDKPNPYAFNWEPIDSRTLFAGDYRPNWLITGAIVERQPCIVGAPQKTLKTTLAVDAGISLATGTPWLGKFACNIKRRVAVMSAESGPFALQETASRVCRSKGIDLDDDDLCDNLRWQFRLPQLAAADQLAAMKEGLERDGIEVVIIDPLYLCLLAGSEGIKAENLFDVGPLLLRVADACLGVGCTPILLHHCTKPSARKLEPLELTDLAFSGTAEFARQWLLLSRREAYEPGSGLHKLWAVVGGSVGHSGLYGLDIDEGQLSEDFSGRKWDVTVESGAGMKREHRDEKTEAKKQSRAERDHVDELALMLALDNLAPGGEAVPYGRVKSLCGLNQDRMSAAFERLIVQRTVCRTTVKVQIGSGAERSSVGIARVVDTEKQQP